MSAKPETTFINALHRKLPTSVYHMKNNNPYVGGIFDKWYSGKSGDLWVEYKFLVLPKRDTTAVEITLSPLQMKWGRERYDEGRNVIVIVGCKEGGVLLTDLEWEKPMACAIFKQRLRSRKELADVITLYTGK